MVSLCISLMTNKVDHLTGLISPLNLHWCVMPSSNMPIFLWRSSVFSLVIAKSSLIYSEYKIGTINIVPRSIGLFVNSLNGSFEKTEVLKFNVI